jgi:hypothetical protein
MQVSGVELWVDTAYSISGLVAPKGDPEGAIEGALVGAWLALHLDHSSACT